jgi:hypothetical protein
MYAFKNPTEEVFIFIIYKLLLLIYFNLSVIAVKNFFIDVVNLIFFEHNALLVQYFLQTFSLLWVVKYCKLLENTFHVNLFKWLSLVAFIVCWDLFFMQKN